MDHRPQRRDPRPPGNEQERGFRWTIGECKLPERSADAQPLPAPQRLEVLSPPSVRIDLDQELENAVARGVVR
jgi:hypothetical protein